jgi:hypothetical protein
MRPALTETPAPPRVPVRRDLIGKSGGAAFELLTWPDGTLSIGCETALGRMRFRVVLDGVLRPRLLMEMPPRERDADALVAVAMALDGLLRSPPGDGFLARLAADAAGREMAVLAAGDLFRRRGEDLRQLRLDLVSWSAMPPAARRPLGGFLAACGSGPSPAVGTDSVRASVEAARSAAAAMVAGAGKPRSVRSDPCLLALSAAVEAARAGGVRSTRHVSVGSPAADAARLDGVPACIGFAAIEPEIAARRVSGEDLLVVTCGVPGDENLARLLRALSRANAAPRIVVYDAEEIVVGEARGLSRILGIPVAAL